MERRKNLCQEKCGKKLIKQKIMRKDSVEWLWRLALLYWFVFTHVRTERCVCLVNVDELIMGKKSHLLIYLMNFKKIER
jgi:hypothetical protein